MQIQISWLLQKPTDLDLHCLQRQGTCGFSRTRVKEISLELYEISVKQQNIIDSSLYHPPNFKWNFTDISLKFYELLVKQQNINDISLYHWNLGEISLKFQYHFHLGWHSKFLLLLFFRENVRLGISGELSIGQMVPMKCQAIISLKKYKQPKKKNNNQNVVCCSCDR